MKHCYQCDRETKELSSRGRCVHCECERSKKNESENELLRQQQMRVLGYVREEVLDLCRHNDNTASLTVVPVAPKTGRWVPIYVEGEKQ